MHRHGCLSEQIRKLVCPSELTRDPPISPGLRRATSPPRKRARVSGYREAIMAEPTVLVEAAGREIAVTSPSKPFFPERGETKLDLVRYYQLVEEPLMRAMQGRPVLLQRYPNGAGGPSFFQKRVPESRPEWLQTAVVSTPNGTTSDALVAADVAHIIWAVNLGCIGFHVWPSQ